MVGWELKSNFLFVKSPVRFNPIHGLKLHNAIVQYGHWIKNLSHINRHQPHFLHPYSTARPIARICCAPFCFPPLLWGQHIWFIFSGYNSGPRLVPGGGYSMHTARYFTSKGVNSVPSLALTWSRWSMAYSSHECLYYKRVSPLFTRQNYGSATPFHGRPSRGKIRPGHANQSRMDRKLIKLVILFHVVLFSDNGTRESYWLGRFQT